MVRLSSHRGTAFLALATALYALFHAANLFAAVSTRLANLGAGSAVQSVVIAVATHEVNTSVTGGDAVEHQFDMCLFYMVATFGKAVASQHVCAGHLAPLAVRQALFHGSGRGTHLLSSLMETWLRPSCRWKSGMQLAYQYGVYCRLPI